jgi:two-component system alkaline phosphatase synthesis response regulator PhoP
LVTALEGKRILLVDDDETILAPFQFILQKEGYQVDTASTGRQALEKAKEMEYQMVISDIKLPDVQGIEVAGKIREQYRDTRLIIITGFPDLADSLETIDLGIDEILIKPIKPDELLRAVKESIQ